MRAYPTSDIKLRQTPPTVLETRRTALSFHHQWHRRLSQQLSSSSNIRLWMYRQLSTSSDINSNKIVKHCLLIPQLISFIRHLRIRQCHATNTDHQYIPFDPLNPPRRRPSPPYRLGEDISGTGMGHAIHRNCGNEVPDSFALQFGKDRHVKSLHATSSSGRHH